MYRDRGVRLGGNGGSEYGGAVLMTMLFTVFDFYDLLSVHEH